jgi:hypothetical protein
MVVDLNVERRTANSVRLTKPYRFLIKNYVYQNELTFRSEEEQQIGMFSG